MSTKKQRVDFRKQAAKLIQKHGGEQVDGENDRWLLPTRYGPLRLHIDNHESRQSTGTVFTRFDDVERTRPGIGRASPNGRGGKWNHHYFSHWTVHSAILDFSQQLQSVAPLLHIQEGREWAEEEQERKIMSTEKQCYADSEDDMTLGQHAEYWWREQGKEVPPFNSPAWWEMYEKWIAFAFADFKTLSD